MSILIILVVIGFAAVILRNVSSSEEKANKIKAAAHKKAAEILSQAQEEALKITKQASTKAQEYEKLLTEGLEAASTQGIEQLRSAALKCVEAYEHTAEVAEKEYLQTLHTASKAMAKDAQETLTMFESYLKDQTVGYEQAMERKVDELRTKANAYIEEYRAKKLERVDSTMHQLILLVAKHVLGRSLNSEEHNRLILHALDEAKKEKFFDEFQP